MVMVDISVRAKYIGGAIATTATITATAAAAAAATAPTEITHTAATAVVASPPAAGAVKLTQLELTAIGGVVRCRCCCTTPSAELPTPQLPPSRNNVDCSSQSTKNIITLVVCPAGWLPNANMYSSLCECACAAKSSPGY